MMRNLLPLCFALIAGVAMAVQGTINSAVGKIVGILEATLLVHVMGLAAICAAVLAMGLAGGIPGKVFQVPWFGYVGGVIGVMIVYLVTASIPKLGAANATTAIIVGQLITALLIDWFGLFGLEKIPLTWYKAAGIGLLLVGARLMLNR